MAILQSLYLRKGNKPVITGLTFLCAFLIASISSAQPAQIADSADAGLYLEKGLQLQEKADYTMSNEYLLKAGSWFEEHAEYDRAAHCYNHVSSNYNLMSRLDSAEAYARKGLTLVSDLPETDKTEEIRSCTLLGLINARRANYDSARKWLERANNLIHHPGVSTSLQTTVIGSLGYLYDDLGEYDKAISLYRQGLEMLTADQGSSKEQVAKLYNNLGYSFTNKGLYDRALVFYKKELETGLEVKGANHPDIAGAYINLGSGYFRKGDWGEAIIYFQKSLDIVRNTVGEIHNLGALNYDNIGMCNIKLGNFEEGISGLHRAVDIKREIFDSNHPEIAESYKHIGMAYAEQDDYHSALDYLEKALSIQRNSLGDRHPRLADTYNKLGKYYVEQEDPQNALNYLKQAESIIAASIETHPALTVTYTLMARAQFQSGHRDRGLTTIQQALEIIAGQFESNKTLANPDISSIDYPLYAVNTLFEKANMLRKTGVEDGKISYVEASFWTYDLLSELLDYLQMEFMDDRSKLAISEKSHTIYENAIQTSYELYKTTGEKLYLNRAFFFAEKSKARVMLEQMNRSNIQHYAGIPDSLVQYEQQLKYKINRVREVIDRKLEGNSSSPLQLPALRDSLFSLNRLFEKHAEHLENRYPRYHRLRYESRMPQVGEVQSALSSDEAVIEYVFGETSLFALVITDSQFQIHKLQHSSSLDNDIADFKQAIFEREKDLYHRKARDLYKLLIQPIAADLKNKTSLLVVPDRSLALMPFEALLTKDVTENSSYADLPYLVKGYAINIIPSVALSSIYRKRQSISPETDFLAFAPVFSKDSAADILFSRKTGRSEPPYLPSSQDEIEQIAHIFRESRNFWNSLWNSEITRLLIGPEATEKAFKSLAQDNAHYIHLATHAFVSETKTDSAGIVFHRNHDGEEDGILYSGEIYNLSMNSELVVLSACETGHGSIVQGEGVMGLSRAFQYAGNANLLASLWKIDDRSTSKLMTAFYKRLLEGKTKKQSLQSAQLELIDDVQFAHPYYWASFILVGN